MSSSFDRVPSSDTSSVVVLDVSTYKNGLCPASPSRCEGRSVACRGGTDGGNQSMRFGWLPGGVSRSAKGPTEWVKMMRPVPSQLRNARALPIWWPVAHREKSRQHPHHTHFVVRCCIARASQVAVLERCTGLLSAHLHLVVRALAGRRKHARMTSAHSEDMELAGNVRRRCRCHPARVKSGQTPSESENVVHPVCAHKLHHTADHPLLSVKADAGCSARCASASSLHYTRNPHGYSRGPQDGVFRCHVACGRAKCCCLVSRCRYFRLCPTK